MLYVIELKMDNVSAFITTFLCTTLGQKNAFFVVLANNARTGSVTTRSWCGKIRLTWAADGPNSSIAGSTATTRTFWSATTVPRPTSGNSRSTTFPTRPAVAPAWDAIRTSGCVPRTASTPCGPSGRAGRAAASHATPAGGHGAEIASNLSSPLSSSTCREDLDRLMEITLEFP